MVVVAVVSPSSGGNVLANSSSVCQFLVTDEQRATTSSVYESWSISHSQLQLITRSIYERVFFISDTVGVYQMICLFYVSTLLWSVIRGG